MTEWRGREAALLCASVAAAMAYPILWEEGDAGAVEIVVKGAAVAALALASGLRARALDGWLLAALLVFGAAGDVLLEIALMAGVAAFALGHGTSIALYLRNRRAPEPWRLAGAALLLVFGAAMPAAILPAGGGVAAFTAYSLLLSGMAAAALLSNFPARVPLGALMFLASDTLIAARMASEERTLLLGLAIWALYYGGQLLIYLGASRGLNLPRPR